MAKEDLVKFGFLPESDISKGIEKNLITEWSVVFTSDSNQIFLIDDKLNPVQIKSQVPVYASVTSANEDIQNNPRIYDGEIVSVFNSTDECFDAYTVNSKPDGSRYIKIVSQKEDVDYNRILHIPIINCPGTVIEPIDLLTLEDGYYKINYFICPESGKQINSLVGNLFVIETDNGTKNIKRISNQNIFDYYIDVSGKCTSNKYVTEQYLKDNKYQTETDVDEKLEAFDVYIQDKIKDYVKNTVEALIIHIVNEVLDGRYGTEADVIALFQ